MNKILIVDDVAGWVNFHKNNIEYLNLDKAEIDTCDCASDALTMIQSAIDCPYDYIFTDLQMETNFLPKLAGQWLIEQVRTYKQYDNSKIIIVSASPFIESIAKKYKVDFLPKAVVRNSDAEIYKKIFSQTD